MPRTLKAGDSYPELHMLLSDANGPVDLTTLLSITVIGKKGATTIGPLSATADTPQSDPEIMGRLTAPIAPADTATIGEYNFYVTVTWSANQVTTFPSTGSETLTIEPID